MWGQVAVAGDTVTLVRIIPTRVGTRVERLDKSIHLKDHPHACGDKRFTTNSRKCGLGSFPRVWGQGGAQSDYDGGAGIIPTRVGTRIDGLQKLL